MSTPRQLGYRQPTLLGYRQQGPTWTQDQLDELAVQRAKEDRGSNALVQGWQSASAGIDAGDLGEAALAAEQAGDTEQAAGLLRRMRVAQAQAQVYAPDTRSVGDVFEDPTRVANWAGGALGSMARSAAPAVGAGLAGAGAGALVAGPGGAVAGGLRGFAASLARTLPAAAVSYDQLRGDQVAQQFDDPEVMKRSADERARQASLTAALQTVPETFLPTRAVSAMVERQIAGQIGKRAANTAVDALAGGGAEVLQQELGYQGQRALGSIKERDPMEYVDAGLAGAVGGLGVSGTSNVLGAAGDQLLGPEAAPSPPVAGATNDGLDPGTPGQPSAPRSVSAKIQQLGQDLVTKPLTRAAAEFLTPDRVLADDLQGADPQTMATKIAEHDQAAPAVAEQNVAAMLQQDRISERDKARLAEMQGKMADPVNRTELGLIMGKNRIKEVGGALSEAAVGFLKRAQNAVTSRFSMEGMDTAPLVDALAPLYAEEAPAAAQSLVQLAAKFEGIKSADAISDPSLAQSLETMADALDAVKGHADIRKGLEAVGLTSMFKLIDELQNVPGAKVDLKKPDSFLRAMLQKRDPRVAPSVVAQKVDQIAPKFASLPAAEQDAYAETFAVAFGSKEAARSVLDHYAKVFETTRETFKKQTDALPELDQTKRGFDRPGNVGAEVDANGLTEREFDDLKATYRDFNPARPFFARSEKKALEAAAASGGVVAGMDEYVRRTGRSAAEAFGRVKGDLERRLKHARSRDKAWAQKELEAQLPALEAKQQEFAAARAAYDAADAAGASPEELQALGAKLPSLKQRDEVAAQIETLKGRVAKGTVRKDLPKLERQYAQLLRDAPAPEDMDPKRFDRALSRYRVVLRDGTDTQASDEDVHRFQRLLRVRQAIKPPAPPKDMKDTEARADYEERLAAYNAKVGAIDETVVTFTTTDGKKLKTSAESMAYASQVKGNDLQKFLSAVSSMLDREDIAGVDLPSSLVVFREGEKRKRRTLGEMRGIAKVRKQLEARAQTGTAKQKAFAKQALALIDEASGQSLDRSWDKRDLAQTRRKRAETAAQKKTERAVADNLRDQNTRESLKGIREEQATSELLKVTDPLREAKAELKELRASYRAASPEQRKDLWPQVEAQREVVAALNSKERVLTEIAREWLDKLYPMPKSQEYTSFLADDVQMEGGYDESDLRAAYLDEAIGVLEERLAAVRPPLTKAEVGQLYALNDQLKTASAKEQSAVMAKIDAISDRFNATTPLIDSILKELNDKKAELNELMDSTGRNPRDGSLRVKDNPSREPNANVRAEQDALAQSLVSAELDPKKIPLMERSFQGKIDELRKKGGVDAAETLRAYQLAMGRLRRIKGKRKGDDPISYSLGPDGKPRALPLDPETSYGHVEPDLRSEYEKDAGAQEHAVRTRRVADATLKVSTEKREDMTALERFNSLQRADLTRRKAFKEKVARLRAAAEKARKEKFAQIDQEAAAAGAEADRENAAALGAMKSVGTAGRQRSSVGESLTMMTSQLKARQDQVVKVVDVLTETLKHLLKNRTDSEAMAGVVDVLERLERIGSQTPAIPKGFNGAREGRQSSNAPPITSAPEAAASDSDAINEEIARARARLKLAKSKRPADKAKNFDEKMQARRAAALERAAAQKEKVDEKEQGREEGRREEGRREEVLKQNAQSVGTGPAVPTTFRELKDALLRMRGKDVEVVIGNLLSGYGKYERTAHGPLVQRLITIAHAAPNKMSVLYHEALHDFFAELGKDPATLRIKQQLLDVASTGHVQRQLRELLANEPAALAQLSDPEERLAYMFQFRMADPDKMRLGPNTQTLFGRIAAAIRKFAKMLTEAEKVEQILLALHDGRLADPSTAAQVMAQWSTFGDQFQHYAGPIKSAIEKVFSANTVQLRSMNIPAFNEIADLFEDNVKKSGLLTARAQSGGVWRNKLEKLLKGHTESEINAAMLHMQSMKDPVTPLHNKLADFFKEIRDWQVSKGVQEFTGGFDPRTGAPIYKPMGLVKRYFPRVWDVDALTRNGPQFTRLLRQHMGLSQAQADSVLHQLRVGDQMLVKPHGVAREAGFSPYAQSVISRELKLTEAGATELAAAGFLSKDFAGVMTRYIDQAVHRAEYAERFGNIGEGLDAMMERAEREGATEAQLQRAKQLISGLDGTIHRDMNSTIKQTQMALLTLQNLVLLPLAVFSQLIDPLGIAVRSGDVRDAGAAYKRVLTDIVQWASPRPDRAREMAEIVGAVQQDSVLQAMGMVHSGMYMSAGLRKANDFLFKYNGMQGINNSFRTAAVTAAEKYILEHRNDARRMEELDLTPADIREVRPGEIDYSSEKIQQALFRFADGAVVRPNAAHRPLWMSDPRFMLVAHLKQFAFSFQEVILKRVAHEASYGNSGPLKVLAMYAPIMVAADMAKWMLTGNMPQNWSLLQFFAHGVHRSGLLGVGTFGADAVSDVTSERSPILGFLGPTAQHLGLLASWIGGGVPVEDVVDRSVPLARLLTK